MIIREGELNLVRLEVIKTNKNMGFKSQTNTYLHYDTGENEQIRGPLTINPLIGFPEQCG